MTARNRLAVLVRLTVQLRGSRLGRFMDEQIRKRRHAISHFESYEIYEHELTTLQTGQSSHQTDLTFFSIAVTVFLCFWTVWLTMPTPLLPNGDMSPLVPLTIARQYYFLAMIGSGALAIFFFVKWKSSSKIAVNVCRVIRERSIGPMGEEGKEIPAGQPLFQTAKRTRQERLQGLADSGVDTWRDFNGEN